MYNPVTYFRVSTVQNTGETKCRRSEGTHEGPQRTAHSGTRGTGRCRDTGETLTFPNHCVPPATAGPADTSAMRSRGSVANISFVFLLGHTHSFPLLLRVTATGQLRKGHPSGLRVNCGQRLRVYRSWTELICSSPPSRNKIARGKAAGVRSGPPGYGSFCFGSSPVVFLRSTPSSDSALTKSVWVAHWAPRLAGTYRLPKGQPRVLGLSRSLAGLRGSGGPRLSNTNPS